MTEYLGNLGQLVGLQCASAETTEHVGRYRVTTGHDGSTTASLRPTVARSWGIRAGLLSDQDLAKLEGFEHGEWGAGPWHWVPIGAQHGNVLPPAESLCLNPVSPSLTVAGPMQGSDGSWSGRSLLTTGPNDAWVAQDIPVLPGVPVTFAMDVIGDGDVAPMIRLVFHYGTDLAVHQGSGTVTDGVQRVSVTVIPEHGVTSASIRIRPSVVRATRPQVTWTAEPVGWSVGKGCQQAVPLGVDVDTIRAVTPGDAISSANYTIQELTV